MIKDVFKKLFSMTTMGILTGILAIGMAVATFVESANGATAAKALVYNARWFEIVIFLTFINIAFNIFRYKLYILKKLPVFLFHLAFLIIILGSSITRYVGYEGTMHIREGETSNSMSSYNTYFYVEMIENGQIVSERQPVMISPVSGGQVNIRIKANGNNLKFKSTDYTSGRAMAAQMTGNQANPNQPDALKVKLTINGAKEELLVRGYLNRQLMPYDYTVNGVQFACGFGTMESQLPFALKLLDFELERYPGTNSASSYASEVMLVDQEKNVEEQHRIFMNHILEYRGYRFYQSGYDQHDEMGTFLSVNHDRLGTRVTYLGYFMMILTIVAALFTPKSRFGGLIRATRKGAALIVLLVAMAGLSSAIGQEQVMNSQLDQNEVEEFGKLWVHSPEGRITPVNTVAQNIIQTIAGKNSFEGMSPEEFWLRTMMNPAYWERQNLFEIKSSDIAVMLGLNTTQVSFSSFFRDGQYILGSYASEVTAKKPDQRNGTDKEILKLDEKLNAFYLAINGFLLNIYPHPDDPQAKWFNIQDKPEGLKMQDSLMITSSFSQYLTAMQSGNLQEAVKWREAISSYQNTSAASVLPNEKKGNLEILYNRILVFERLAIFYAMIGLLFMIAQFMNMFKPKDWLNKLSIGFTGLLGIGFVIHTIGLAIRWYVSGHAPMSNGYESMIFVAWGTLLAGLIIVRRSQMAMALTGILAAIALLVAHLSWMSPEITNLVPVLRSVWLTIHVAVIMTSYSFLGLGALIGFVVLILYILKTRSNMNRLDQNIIHLTRINQIVIVVGLYLITIGCFLGAIWANEAWGRYWGWDPKETWTLICILVYSFVIHMHNIKGLNNPFSFNLGSLLAFSSIIMTYFGVNYFLGGMHSYAGGDAPEIPLGAYAAVIVVVILMYWAYFNQQRLVKFQKAK